MNYDFEFKRIFDLSNSMCEEVSWNKKIKENLSNFKQIISLEFKDDLMLQLYIKYNVSSIFNKVHLYKIFCHFVYCKRSFDSDIEFCRMCSRIYPNCVIDEFYLFDEILIDDRFSSEFKAFFLPQYYMFLDIKYPYYC